MAEELNNQEALEGQPLQDAGTRTTDDSAAAGGQAAEGAAGEPDYKTEFEKLQGSYKELQGEFTSVSQEAARTRQLMETLQPFIDYSRMGGQPPVAGSGQEDAELDDTEPLTRKQVQELMNNMAQELRGQIIAQNVRTKYPDVCDGDWKEVIVRNELAKLARTHPYDTPEQRIDKAVAAARQILKGEREAGKADAEVERKKADEEARRKAAAAAKASGLESTGTSSPAPKLQDENKPVTADEYAQARQHRRYARETL